MVELSALFHGFAVVLTPFAVAPSVRIAMVEDPDGNHVEFLERS